MHLPRQDNKTLAHVCHSGGNLAAVLTHKAALHNPSIPIIFQLLIVPVIDNTPPDNQTSSDHPYPSWYENRYTPSLSPAKMLWFRNFYLPNVADRKEWDASPILAPEQSFRDVPNAWIAVCELDILRDEGIKYAEVLRKYNKEVEVVVYKGSPHPIMANDKVCIFFEWKLHLRHLRLLAIVCSQGEGNDYGRM